MLGSSAMIRTEDQGHIFIRAPPLCVGHPIVISLSVRP